MSPRPADVLDGRGGLINSHIGNVRFRALVNSRRLQYLDSTKKAEKALIAASIVAEIRSSGGRFLREFPETIGWVEIGNERATKKAGQALREIAPKLRAEGLARLAMKKRLSADFASSPANPSHVPASKMLKTTTKTFASSSIATAIEAKEKVPSSLSLRFDPSSEAQSFRSNYPSVRRVSDDDMSGPAEDEDCINTSLSYYSLSYNGSRKNKNITNPPISNQNPLDLLSSVSSQVAHSATRRAAHGPMLATSKSGEESPAVWCQQVEPNTMANIVDKYIEKFDVGDSHPVTVSYPNGCRYVGQLVSGMRQGHGKCWDPQGSGVYTGQWYQNEKHGLGHMVYTNGNVYTGVWYRDSHNGKGILLMKDGKEIYDGGFVNNKKHGRGVHMYADGNVYKGMWLEDVRHGEGVMKFDDGRVSRLVYHRGVFLSST
ncbi:hypothetical protein ACHAW5_003468 [Stephanodiscus triporus]|uniref:DUF6824 domain-containing protein n=1 Tax=Stephanodiscus triporus TaxID=2934178 RepID=A0ABD3MQ42_9STRA